MVTRTTSKICQPVVALFSVTVLTVLTVCQFSSLTPSAFVSRTSRSLGSSSTTTTPYNINGSIITVMNTPKTGTGGLFQTLDNFWHCHDSGHRRTQMFIMDCGEENNSFSIARTHSFVVGAREIQRQRERHPDGQCLIVTALRSPASWFGSAYLQTGKNDWKPKEEMVEEYRRFLASGESTRMMESVLPDLLGEFNGGSLVHQTEIMARNGGYSRMGPAPSTSILAGCDLLFLKMEDSDQWPQIMRMMINPDIEYKRGVSRLQQHPEAIEQIDAIAAYKLTSEEKSNIYMHGNSFIRDWFDSYRYMDDVGGDKVGDSVARI